MQNIEELSQIKTEKRLVKTLLTKKPSKMAFLYTVSILFIMSFVSLLYWKDPFGLSVYMPAIQKNIFGLKEWWRVISATFIHADGSHLLSNLYMLGIFSFFIFGYFNLRLYFVTVFIAASMVNAITVLTYAPDVKLIGASGLVYVLGGFWLSMYLFIQRQYGVLNRLLRTLGVALIIFFPTSFVPTTSYKAHAFGFVIGALLGGIYFLANKKEIRKQEVYKVIDSYEPI